MALKRLPQGNIHIIHADRIAKVYKACHAKRGSETPQGVIP